MSIDLIVTAQKSLQVRKGQIIEGLRSEDSECLMKRAIDELPFNEAQNPSHVYERILRNAIRQHYVLDILHLSDVSLALRKAGYTPNRKTGLLSLPVADVSPAS